MARYGCLALAVVVAMALLILIVFFWSGWLNRPVGRAAFAPGPTAVFIASDPPTGAAAISMTAQAW